MVSFGSAEGAARWKTDANCSDIVVLDEKRAVIVIIYLIKHKASGFHVTAMFKLYNYFGLHVSFSKVWCSETMKYYAGQKQQGKEFLKPFENVEDDPLQVNLSDPGMFKNQLLL